MLVQANYHRNSKSILWLPSKTSLNSFHKIDKEFLIQLLSIRFFQIYILGKKRTCEAVRGDKIDGNPRKD